MLRRELSSILLKSDFDSIQRIYARHIAVSYKDKTYK